MTANETGHWPSSRRAWYIVFVTCLAYIVSNIDRHVITILVPPMKRDLGFSDEQIGYIIGLCFALPYAGLVVPIGYLADRWGRKRLLLWGITFWSLMTALSAVSRNVTMLGLARAGLGLGEATLAPSALPMIADSFPPERRSVPMALYLSGASVGIALAMTLGGLVVHYVDHLPPVTLPVIGVFYAWQSAFLIAGGLALVVAVLIAFAPEPPRRSLRREPVKWGDALRYFLARPWAYAALFLGSACFGIAGHGITSWMPAHLARSLGADPKTIAILMTSIVLPAGLGGSLLAGLVSQWAARTARPDRMIWTAIVLMLLAGCAYVAAIQASSALLCMLLFGLGLMQNSLAYALQVMAVQNATPPEYRSQATAWWLFSYSIFALGVGPVVIGTLSTRVLGEASLGSAIGWTVAIGVIGSALLYRLGLRTLAREISRIADAERSPADVAPQS